MSLQLSGYVDLQDSRKSGGFDHAAVHRASARVYVAHTANDTLSVPTEKGAHTIAFDPDRNKVYAFLPQTHRAAVYGDQATKE